MSTFGPGKYLVIAPVKCNILQDISPFKKNDIKKMTIPTITHFKNPNLIAPSFHLVTKPKGDLLHQFPEENVGKRHKYLVFAFAVKDWGFFFQSLPPTLV